MDYEKTHFVQMKFVDLAKAWFHHLDEYDSSWRGMEERSALCFFPEARFYRDGG